MLPAVSASLPAYLVPPRSRPDDQTQKAESLSRFGPDARVDVAADGAAGADHAAPEPGLYGPNGKFVEAAGRREVRLEARNVDRDEGPGDEVETTQEPETAQRRHDSRDLSLKEFDVTIPPAAREELKALADRVDRQTVAQTFDVKDYRRIETLMERLGRFDEAQRARARAESIQEQRAADPSSERPNALLNVATGGAAATDTE